MIVFCCVHVIVRIYSISWAYDRDFRTAELSNFIYDYFYKQTHSLQVCRSTCIQCTSTPITVLTVSRPDAVNLGTGAAVHAVCRTCRDPLLFSLFFIFVPARTQAVLVSTCPSHRGIPMFSVRSAAGVGRETRLGTLSE